MKTNIWAGTLAAFIILLVFKLFKEKPLSNAFLDAGVSSLGFLIGGLVQWYFENKKKKRVADVEGCDATEAGQR